MTSTSTSSIINLNTDFSNPDNILALTGKWCKNTIYAIAHLSIANPPTWDTDSIEFFASEKAFVSKYEAFEKQINDYAKDKNKPTFRGIIAFEWKDANAARDSLKVVSRHLLPELRNISVEPKTDGEPDFKFVGEAKAVQAKTHTNSISDMVEQINKYADGLISLPELLLALQLTTHQVNALIEWTKLPNAFALAIDIPVIDKLADRYLNGVEIARF